MEAQTTQHPDFWQGVVHHYQAAVAHSFILHGNIHDHVQSGGAFFRLSDYLNMRLASSCVIRVSLGRGIEFPNPVHRGIFMSVLGLDKPAATPGSPALAAALGRGNGTPAAEWQSPTSMREIVALLDQLLSRLTWLHNEKQANGTTRVVVVPASDLVGKTEDEISEAGWYRFTCSIIFWRADLMIPNADLNQTDTQLLARLLSWARDPQVGADHLLFLVAESFLILHEELRRPSSRWQPFEVRRPDTNERGDFIYWRITEMIANGDKAAFEEGFDADALARTTGMLTREQVDDVIFRGSTSGVISSALANQAKREIVAQEFGEVVQVDEPRFGFDRVGGYDTIKAGLGLYVTGPWFRRGRLTTSGILMMGPAGTGKTQLAEALAGTAGVPFVVVRLSRILGQYVGNSERNWERLERGLFALGACVVFIDEIDQVFKRGSGGDSGGSQVDNRIFASFLAFMENPDRMKAGILVVAATNRPDLVDSALRSRLGLRVPVLLPTMDDRIEVLGALVREHFGADDAVRGIDAMIAVASKTEGWSGRDLRGLVLKAAQLMDATGEPIDAVLGQALGRMRPETSADTAIQTALALRFCSDLDFLPAEQAAEALTIDTPEPEPVAPASVRPTRRRGL